MKFKPEEVLFSPTTKCNLFCPHCDIKRSDKALSTKSAIKFLRDCKRSGIERVGFTGGEPFLALHFLCAVTKAARKLDMTFDRIMTNGVWFKDRAGLLKSLGLLHKAGYDGSICVSVDIFHKQNLKNLALFIETASNIWDRPDVVSIAYVAGYKDAATKQKIQRLLRLLDKSLFIKTFKIDLTHLHSGNARGHSRNGKWFKDDFCKGPGNVFLVMPNGDVKPCCGYATENEELTIGNIHRDSVKDILKNAGKNRFISAVFGDGLGAIRKRLQRLGVKFPGKTKSHCYFCNYLLRNIPRNLLAKCL